MSASVAQECSRPSNIALDADTVDSGRFFSMNTLSYGLHKNILHN